MWVYNHSMHHMHLIPVLILSQSNMWSRVLACMLACSTLRFWAHKKLTKMWSIIWSSSSHRTACWSKETQKKRKRKKKRNCWSAISYFKQMIFVNVMMISITFLLYILNHPAYACTVQSIYPTCASPRHMLVLHVSSVVQIFHGSFFKGRTRTTIYDQSISILSCVFFHWFFFDQMYVLYFYASAAIMIICRGS